jgi:hypothetical protein
MNPVALILPFPVLMRQLRLNNAPMIQKIRHFIYIPGLLLCLLRPYDVSAQDPASKPVPVSSLRTTRAEFNAGERYVDDVVGRKTPYAAISGGPLWNYEGVNDPGFQLSTRIGYDFHPRLAVEFETGWWSIDDTFRNIDFGQLNAVPLMINFPIKLPVNNRIIPYVSPGGGLFIFGFNQRDSLPRNSFAEYDHVGLAAKAGGGLDLFLTKHIAFNVESGVYFIQDPEVRTRIRGVGVKRESNVDSLYILFGLKYKF